MKKDPYIINLKKFKITKTITKDNVPKMLQKFKTTQTITQDDVPKMLKEKLKKMHKERKINCSIASSCCTIPHT